MDYNDLWPPYFRTNTAAAEAARKLEDERRQADADLSVKFANLQMPEDIRSRARSWRMEAFFEVLWNSAFQAGYREAMRDRTPDDTPQDGGQE